MTMEYSATRRKLCGIPFHPCLAEESPGKVHLSHSDQKDADRFYSSLQIMTAGTGICWHLPFTESSEGRKLRECRENNRHGVIWHQAFLAKFCFLLDKQCGDAEIPQ